MFLGSILESATLFCMDYTFNKDSFNKMQDRDDTVHSSLTIKQKQRKNSKKEKN